MYLSVCRCAIDALQHAAPHVKVVIYVREGVTVEQLVHDADSRFNVKLRGPIEVRTFCAIYGESVLHVSTFATT